MRRRVLPYTFIVLGCPWWTIRIDLDLPKRWQFWKREVLHLQVQMPGRGTGPVSYATRTLIAVGPDGAILWSHGLS
jgi:hypothetical protein